MFIVQVNDRHGRLKEIVHIGLDRDVASEHFLSALGDCISNWYFYSVEQVGAILNKGYEIFGGGAVLLIDTDDFTSDKEIAAMFSTSPGEEVNKITRWLQTGEIGPVKTIDEVLKGAARCLDKAFSWDICGPVLFQAEDGKWYVLAVEANITEAHPDYIKDELAEIDFEEQE